MEKTRKFAEKSYKEIRKEDYDRELTEPILNRFVDVARNGFGSKMEEDDVRFHVKSSDFLHQFHDNLATELPVGFASYNVHEVHGMVILYVNGAVVAKEYQRSGFLSESMRLMVNKVRPDYLVFCTQNPVMYHMAAKMGVTFPSFEEPDNEAIAIGSVIAALRGKKKYEPKSFLERGTYGKSLYAEVPEVSDSEVNKLFREKLKLDTGRWRFGNGYN